MKHGKAIKSWCHRMTVATTLTHMSPKTIKTCPVQWISPPLSYMQDPQIGQMC